MFPSTAALPYIFIPSPIYPLQSTSCLDTSASPSPYPPNFFNHPPGVLYIPAPQQPAHLQQQRPLVSALQSPNLPPPTTTPTEDMDDEEDDSEQDRRLSIDFLLNSDGRPASSRHTAPQPQPQSPLPPLSFISPPKQSLPPTSSEYPPTTLNLSQPPFNMFNELATSTTTSTVSSANNLNSKHNLALPNLNGKKTRRRLTHEELYLLESVYSNNQTPDSFTKIKLSQMLIMSPQQVSNWYVCC